MHKHSVLLGRRLESRAAKSNGCAPPDPSVCQLESTAVADVPIRASLVTLGPNAFSRPTVMPVERNRASFTCTYPARLSENV